MTIGLIANNDGTGAVQLGGSNAISLDTSLNATMAGYVNAPNTFGFKNRIINGAMQIDQRNAGASLTSTAAPIYSLDRWAINASQASKYTVQQNAGSVTPPVGFTNYLGITSSSSYSVLVGDYFLIFQPIEGLNCADLGWGTANAATVTLSFWVRSSLTGTFGGSLRNSAGSRSYPFSFTINSANTFEQKTITISGDTTGTWLTTNGVGIYVSFSLGAGATFGSGTVNTWQAGNYIQSTGATSVVGTSGATFYITGVQLEKGSTATSFDFRSIGTELALAQRYYCQGTFCSLHPNATTAFGTSARNTLYIPPPRTTPTCTVTAVSVTSPAATPYLDTSGGCVIYFTGTATGSAYVSAWTASSEL